MSDPQCTFHTDHPEHKGRLMRCSGDAGHGKDHYYEDDRGEIPWWWTGSGPAQRGVRR